MSENASAIGLFSYSAPHPGREGFARFYEAALSIFTAAGIVPGWIAAEGAARQGEFKKFGGRTHANLLTSGFDGVDVLSIAATPAGSDDPGYDALASASLSYVSETGETVLSFFMLERDVPFGSELFERSLRTLLTVRPWDFGFAFADRLANKPEFHILGLDDGKLNAVERSKLTRWYSAPAAERLAKLRDVYPYNIVNDQQLGAIDSVAASVGALRKLEGIDRLHLWAVPQDDVEVARVQLQQLHALISF